MRGGWRGATGEVKDLCVNGEEVRQRGVFPYSTRGRGRYMKACHIAKVEVRALLVQTVTSRARPKHFQMSANSVTGAASMWRLGGGGEGWRDGGRKGGWRSTAHCKGEG